MLIPFLRMRPQSRAHPDFPSHPPEEAERSSPGRTFCFESRRSLEPGPGPWPWLRPRPKGPKGPRAQDFVSLMPYGCRVSAAVTECHAPKLYLRAGRAEKAEQSRPAGALLCWLGEGKGTCSRFRVGLLHPDPLGSKRDLGLGAPAAGPSLRRAESGARPPAPGAGESLQKEFNPSLPALPAQAISPHRRPKREGGSAHRQPVPFVPVERSCMRGRARKAQNRELLCISLRGLMGVLRKLL